MKDQVIQIELCLTPKKGDEYENQDVNYGMNKFLYRFCKRPFVVIFCNYTGHY